MKRSTDLDSTDYRKRLWEKEYGWRKYLPSTTSDQPSRVLKHYLPENTFHNNKALDLGSGTGRNSFYLSENGFDEVVGIEFSEIAIAMAEAKKAELNLHDQVRFIHQSLGDPLDFPEEYFDLIVDMMTLHSLNLSDREVVVGEIKRLLKQKGQYLLFTTSDKDENAVKMMEENPGEDGKSYRFKIKDDWVSEKAFSKSYLIKLLQPLKMIDFQEHKTKSKAFGDVYEKVYLSAVFKK